MNTWSERVNEFACAATAYGRGFWRAPPLMFDAFFEETDLRGRSFTFELFFAAMVSLLWWKTGRQ